MRQGRTRGMGCRCKGTDGTSTATRAPAAVHGHPAAGRGDAAAADGRCVPCDRHLQPRSRDACRVVVKSGPLPGELHPAWHDRLMPKADRVALEVRGRTGGKTQHGSSTWGRPVPPACRAAAAAVVAVSVRLDRRTLLLPFACSSLTNRAREPYVSCWVLAHANVDTVEKTAVETTFAVFRVDGREWSSQAVARSGSRSYHPCDTRAG
jgi:hypothetical protein